MSTCPASPGGCGSAVPLSQFCLSLALFSLHICTIPPALSPSRYRAGAGWHVLSWEILSGGRAGWSTELGLIVCIFRAHRVPPWEVLLGVGVMGGNPSWDSLSVTPEHTAAFRCDAGPSAAGKRSGGTRATPPRIPLAVLSHTGSHMVSPRATAQPVHTRAARARCHMHAGVAAPVMPPHAGARTPLLRSPQLARAAQTLLRRSAGRAWRGGGGACILMTARPHCARRRPGSAPGSAPRGAAAARG